MVIYNGICPYHTCEREFRVNGLDNIIMVCKEHLKISHREEYKRMMKDKEEIEDYIISRLAGSRELMLYGRIQLNINQLFSIN